MNVSFILIHHIWIELTACLPKLQRRQVMKCRHGVNSTLT